MRAERLLPSPTVDGPTAAQAHLRRVVATLGGQRLRGGSDLDAALTILGPCFCVIILAFGFMVSSLEPNEYGLMKNSITGSIAFEVDRGGIHLTGPFKNYIKFPAAQSTLEFSKASYERPPVQTRTGADPNDPDSGGQPIAISVAMQYVFVEDTVRDVYLSFGSYEAARERYLLLAGNMISNTAQEYTPQDFWQIRDKIAVRFFNAVNQTLWESGYVILKQLEIMKVDFAMKFENSITQVQVAEQQQEINKYDQQVQQVVQKIEVMKSENNANIANIQAEAVAKSREIEAGAKRDAFNLKQTMKAQKYAQLQRNLSLTQPEMTEYFKIKALQGQEQTGKVVVGLPGIDSADGPYKA